MAKMQSTLTNMLLSLTGITLVAAAALAGVYMLTQEPIAKAEKEKQQEAIVKVLPQVEGMRIADPERLEEEGVILYRAYLGEEWIGTAVEVDTRNNKNLPFGGTIKAMVGFDNEGNIINYQVLSHAETPGLGAKMDTWFAQGGKGSIIGLNPQRNRFSVKKDGGDVDAITAATITSRAFLEMVATAYNQIGMASADACSGATIQQQNTSDSTTLSTGCCQMEMEAKNE